MIPGHHGVASGGRSHDVLVFPQFRGAARVPGRGRSCNSQDMCVLPVVECWNFPRFAGSRRDRPCNLQGICFAPLLGSFETPTFCRAGAGPPSCNLAGILLCCLASVGLEIYDPWQFNFCNIRNVSLARLPLISASLVQRSGNTELRFYD